MTLRRISENGHFYIYEKQIYKLFFGSIKNNDYLLFYPAVSYGNDQVLIFAYYEILQSHGIKYFRDQCCANNCYSLDNIHREIFHLHR